MRGKMTILACKVSLSFLCNHPIKISHEPGHPEKSTKHSTTFVKCISRTCLCSARPRPPNQAGAIQATNHNQRAHVNAEITEQEAACHGERPRARAERDTSGSCAIHRVAEQPTNRTEHHRKAWFPRARRRRSKPSTLPPTMTSSLLPATSGGARTCPSPPRLCRRRCRHVIAAASVLPPSDSVGRRAVSLAGLAAWLATTTAGRADASPFDKYVKRKKLEPLETYVPAVLLTRDQFVDLEKSLEFEKPKYDESRSLLRSGPASSLRVNIRAVAQYASSNGQGKAASDAVDECLRALEDLDSLLLRASRNDPSTSVETMRSKISIALAALDNLLQTVPSAVMDKGKAIADAYRTPADDYVEENAAELDPRLKQLEDIL